MMTSDEDDVKSDHDSTTSSDPEDEGEIRKRVPALAVTREKRSNAGSKMQALLQQTLAADDDDFYTSTYGGFNEVDDDNDFASDQEEADDELDSDFDVDEAQVEETAEGKEEEDEESKVSRRGKKVKLAYEVSAQNRARKEKQNKVQTKKEQTKKVEEKKEVKPKTSIPVKRPLDKPPPVPPSDEKRVLRTRVSIYKDDDEYEPVAKRRRSGSKRGKKKEKDRADKVWTQAELLEEAKKTEIENLKSLEKYQLLELEKLESKKRLKRHERKLPSSYIRIVSTSMPLVEEIKSPNKGSNDEEAPKDNRVERKFITFSDDHAFKTAFPCLAKKEEPQLPVGAKRSNLSSIKKGQAICPISHLRARYFDPVTQLPFASSTTFRALRESYSQQLEMFYGKILRPEGISTEDGPVAHAKTLSKLKNDGVLDWLEHRKEMKKQQTTPVKSSSGVE